LIRVGGPFTQGQNELVQALKLGDAVQVLPFLSRKALAAVYRRASLALQPSEREGFGLPVVEAMACGTNVVASDIDSLREAGGEAATYCPVGEVAHWSDAVVQLLGERKRDPAAWEQRRIRGLAQATRFSWSEHARKVVAVYETLLT
ncbi:MAG: glycosyltransferase, partial [Acidobacteriota bacterium]